MRARSPALIVVLLVALGAVVRLVLAHQSLFADELSTQWIVARSGGPGDVVSFVHTDAEITPPLYFVLAWIFTRISSARELLRTPSLLAGVALIPLVYLTGRRTVGRRAALTATALVAFSPFLVYYSGEARSYELMVALVTASTLAMLKAIDGGRHRWWVAYGVASCAAVYTHYTSVFVLAGQLLWLLWAHPPARRPAILANVGAVALFAPWLSGLRADFSSPTTQLLSSLQPFTPDAVRFSLEHWSLGNPSPIPPSRLTDLPGVPALVALAVSLLIAAGALVIRARKGAAPVRPSAGLLLVVVLAVSVPVGESLASAVGADLVSTRNLAGSWPGLALLLAALLIAAGPRLGLAAAALAIFAFVAGSWKLTQTSFHRPDAQAVARFVDREASPTDPVVDGTFSSPVGVPGALDFAVRRPHRLVPLFPTRVSYDPFRIIARAPPPEAIITRTLRSAGGRRVFFVLDRDAGRGSGSAPGSRAPITFDTSVERLIERRLPAGYRRLAVRDFPGALDLRVLVYGRDA